MSRATPRAFTFTAIGLVLAATAGFALQAAQAKAPVEAAVQTPARVDNFRLVDADGKAHELYRLKDASAVVMIANGADLKKSAKALESLRATYAARGVEFLVLDTTPDGGAQREAIGAKVKALGLSMPVLMDDNQLVGEQIGATRAAEAFVVNPKTWAVAYHGAIVDGKKAPLAKALDAVIAGQPVAVAAVPAKGEKLAFPGRTEAAKASYQKISYSQTIAPMLEEKCVACHQQGGIAPFAMDSYEKVKGFAPMIRESIRTDRMPPWDVDAHVGTFADDKSLSADQIKTLVHWIEAGAPRGEGPDRLAEVKHVAPEWPLGKPDMIVDIPKYVVPASGVVDYQYPTTPNPLTEGKWLKASTAKVTQRQAVHHILSGIIPEGQTQKGMEAWGGSVGGYTVGMESVVQPKGVGSYIPAGGDFAYQMHYTPFGKEVTSAEQIGLYFYKDGEKPELVMRENALVDQFIKIPPNDPAHKEVAYFNFPHDAILHTAVVHAHYRGTYSKLEIRYPDGKQETILNVPFYDFNWQRMYEFAKPIDIPAGSKVIATYIYDNSKRNPANPDPNAEVVWGDQSFEEMFYTSLRYRWKDETVEKQTTYDQDLLKTRLIGMMDDNIDNKVQIEELRGGLGDAIRPRFAMADANKDGGIDAKEFEPILKMMQQNRAKAAPAAETAPAAKPAATK
jgi:hypothetical protein